MKLALDYMGATRTYTFGASVAACRWEDVKGSKKLAIEQKLEKKAKKFYKSLVNRKKLRKRIFTRAIFLMIKGMLKSYEDGNVDKEYWRKQGWL